MSTMEAQEADFSDTPHGWANRWKMELTHAKEVLEPWRKEGMEIVRRFRDEREDRTRKTSRWNLYYSNVTTQRSMMYGNVPQVSVERRFADAADDQARVAADMLERALNADIEKGSDTYAQALGYALSDFLLPGLAAVRLRYVPTFEDTPEEQAITGPDGRELAPAVPAGQRKSYECVETNYLHWQDVLWSPCRVWHEVRWLAFRTEMSRKQLEQRFGKDVAALIPMNAKRRDDEEKKKPTPWARAEVHEIWDKESKSVYWWVDGYHQVLDIKPDPLGLEGFFPCPEFMIANATTDELLPVPDFRLAQDLYLEIDALTTRINRLIKALRVVGAYSGDESLRKLVDETCENELVHVQNWNAFAEKGGIKGQVDWFPIEPVVATVMQLMQARRENMDALFQITGMSDLMRGQQVANGTPGEAQVKAKFGSVRMQALQDRFARFASDIQRIKAEIMAKHFEPASILALSNVEHTPDAAMAESAVALIKSDFAKYRIDVKPEAVSMTDFAELKAERMEVVSSMASFVQAIVPMVSLMPQALPHLLQAFQWAMAGLRGASGLETVLDQAVASAQQAQQQAAAQPQQQQPDPKLLAQQMKGQQDQQKISAELQADLVRTEAEVQADARREQTQAMWNSREAAQKAALSAATRQPGISGTPARTGRPT